MKATLEKVINGFILEIGNEKRVGITLNDLMPTIYGMCHKEIKDCAEEIGQTCWELEIEINVTPTTKQESDCEVKEVPCKEKKDIPIGEVIEYKGKHLLCVESGRGCAGCYFDDNNISCGNVDVTCNGGMRKDGKDVIFVGDKSKS